MTRRLTIMLLVFTAWMFASSFTFDDFQFPGSPETFSIGINNSGSVAGWYLAPIGIPGGPLVIKSQAFIRVGGAFETLNPTADSLPSGSYSALADGINDANQVVGRYMVDGTVGFTGFLYSNGSFTDIIHPESSPGGSTEANGINNSGQIVGSFDRTLTAGRSGFLLEGELFTSINFPDAISTWATDINDFGQIVGYYVDDQAQEDFKGFLYSGGVFTTVSIPGLTGIQVWAINNSGEMAGTFFDGIDFRGFIYRGGEFIFPDHPNASRTLIGGINNSGQITGSFHSGSSWDSFVATPIPELSSLNLVFTGLVMSGLFCVARRKKRF